MTNKNFLLLISCLLIFSGCVSVQLGGGGAPKKSKNVSYTAPSKPFKESQSPNSDEIWASTKTASTISYFSSCSDTEPSLKSIRSSVLQGFEDFKITKEQTIEIDDREGLQSTVDGKLEGVPVRIEFIVFKKNSCSYNLTYVALKENFDKELNEFNKFITSFKVP